MVAAGHMVAVAGLDVVAAGEEVAPAGEHHARSRQEAALVPPGRTERPGGTCSGHRILRVLRLRSAASERQGNPETARHLFGARRSGAVVQGAELRRPGSDARTQMPRRTM